MTRIWSLALFVLGLVAIFVASEHSNTIYIYAPLYVVGVLAIAPPIVGFVERRGWTPEARKERRGRGQQAM